MPVRVSNIAERLNESFECDDGCKTTIKWTTVLRKGKHLGYAGECGPDDLFEPHSVAPTLWGEAAVKAVGYTDGGIRWAHADAYEDLGLKTERHDSLNCRGDEELAVSQGYIFISSEGEVSVGSARFNSGPIQIDGVIHRDVWVVEWFPVENEP